MKLVELTKEILESNDKERNEERNKEHFYASDAGKCRRQMYYSLEFKKPLESNSAESILRMNAGKKIEEAIIDEWDKAGILVEEQVRIEEAITDKHEIHGYADAIINVEGRPTPVEIKSFYGYHQAKELREGRPNKNYIYQLAIYMHFLGYSEGILYYIDRSDMSMFEFDVVLNEGEIILDFGGTWESIGYVKDIISGFKQVSADLEKEIVPEPDFAYKYDLMDFTAEAKSWTKSKLDAEIKKFRPISQVKGVDPKTNKGKVLGYEYSGTVYPKKDDAIVAFLADAQHGILPAIDSVCGDWNCKYCDYKTHCLESQGVSLGYDHVEYMDRLETLIAIRKEMK